MHDNRGMASRLLTFVVWLVVLATAAFWGFKVFVQKPALPAQAAMPARGLAMGGELKRLLGASVVATAPEEAEEEPEASRFQLLGVVAPRGASLSAQGVALISVDGEPAKAWRTGATIVDDTVLLAVEKRTVRLGPRGGPATTELTLPEPAAAATGVPGVPANGVRPIPNAVYPQGAAPMRPGGVLQPGQQFNGMPQAGAQPMPRPGQPAQQMQQMQQAEEEEPEEEAE
jgi:general secretion pathway protein C